MFASFVIMDCTVPYCTYGLYLIADLILYCDVLCTVLQVDHEKLLTCVVERRGIAYVV